MPYIGHALTLPLESEYEEQFTDAEIMLLTVDSDDPKTEKSSNSVNRTKTRKVPKSVEITKQKRESFELTHYGRIKFLWRMIIWHLFLFLAVTSSLYAIFHYGFDNSQKELILQALSFCDDWKQMAFFLGIYISFAVKKVSDIIGVSHFSKLSISSKNGV